MHWSAGMLQGGSSGNHPHCNFRFAKPKFDKHQRHPSPLDCLAADNVSTNHSQTLVVSVNSRLFGVRNACGLDDARPSSGHLDCGPSSALATQIILTSHL